MKRLPETPSGGSRSVLNAIDILESFGHEHQRQSLAGICARLELPKATALRHLRAMNARGYLLYDAVTKTYALGPATFALAQRYLDQYESLLAGRRILVSLADRTGETAHIGVLQGREIVYLDIAESPQRIRAYVLRGDRIPAHAVASGKAMLAHAPAQALGAFLDRPLQPLTPATITDPVEFRAELQRVRQQGYAANIGEWIEEVGACSAPIFAPEGVVVGAIGIAGPINRLNAGNIAGIGEIVREHAQSFGRLFQGRAAA